MVIKTLTRDREVASSGSASRGPDLSGALDFGRGVGRGFLAGTLLSLALLALFASLRSLL